MTNYSLTHLTDEALDREFDTSVRRLDCSTADMLARLAEFDARKRYLPAGYGSMWDYCREKRDWSKDVTSQRIQAAKTAREYPAIFGLLAEGRLELCGIRLLAPHLTPQNAAELLAKAADRSKREVAEVLRSRAAAAEPDGEGNPRISQQNQHAPGHVNPTVQSESTFQLESPEAAPATAPHPAGAPLHLWIDAETEEELRLAQALLSHTKDYRDIGNVLKRALKALTAKLQTKRFGGSMMRKKMRNGSPNPRYIPAHVRREVLLRDGFGCQHTGPDGHVCGSTHQLEFDHKKPVAEGGAPPDERLDTVERALFGHFRLPRQEAHERALAICAAMPGASLNDVVKEAAKAFAPTRGVYKIPAPPKDVAFAAPVA